MRLSGKLVVITGGASGIGRAGALLFAQEGARVVIIDRDWSALEEVTKLGPKGAIMPLVSDLSDSDQSRQSMSDAIDRLGGLNVFWGNAGVVGPAGIEDLSLEDYTLTEAINLRSNVMMSGIAVAHMRKHGGAILFTSSISGIVGSRKSPVYAVTKHALIGLARSMAIAHGPDKIRVNAICPGITETPMLPSAMGRGLSTEEMLKNKSAHLESVPLGRVATANEIAKAALWLVSDDASYVTGVALPVDGGYTCA